MASTETYKRLARKYARRYGLDPNVFQRQIQQESGFNPRAQSPAGARGIAQIMPGTARGWGVNPDDPKQSLKVAARNMATYVKKYGSYKNALVAYNAGPGRVGKPLYAETQNYVNRILGGSEPASRPSRQDLGGRPASKGPSPADRRTALLSYLDNQGKPSALLELASGLQADSPSTPKRVTSKPSPSRTRGDSFASQFGLRKTSGYRTPAHNAAVGGVPNSAHMRGSPRRPGAEDFVGSEKAMQRAAKDAKRRGAKQVLIHDAGSGRHLHVEW